MKADETGSSFQPDYRHVLQVLYNRRPGRMPLYEHHIDPPFISRALGKEIVPQGAYRPIWMHIILP